MTSACVSAAGPCDNLLHTRPPARSTGRLCVAPGCTPQSQRRFRSLTWDSKSKRCAACAPMKADGFVTHQGPGQHRTDSLSQLTGAVEHLGWTLQSQVNSHNGRMCAESLVSQQQLQRSARTVGNRGEGSAEAQGLLKVAALGLGPHHTGFTCVCIMHVCMYVCCAYAHLCVHVCTRVYACVLVCACMCAVHVCARACALYACVCVQVCIYM